MNINQLFDIYFWVFSSILFIVMINTLAKTKEERNKTKASRGGYGFAAITFTLYIYSIIHL